jgi:predicted RND superfamily exporter protein
LLASTEGNLDDGLKSRSNASIINSITMIACSVIFILYAFEPPKTFGVLLMLGIFLSLVGDYWILKGLLRDRYQE